MRLIKKYFVMLTVFTLLLSACDRSVSIPRGTVFTTVSGAADTVLPRQMTLAISMTSSKAMQTAAENFCKRINLISKNGLTLTLLRSDDALADFKSGKANFVLLDYKSASSLHPFFEICGERFQYSSYESFSTACNSSSVLSMLSENSDSNVLAAFYTGSNVFLSNTQLNSLMRTDRDQEPQDSDVRNVTVIDPAFAESLSEMAMLEKDRIPNIFVTAAKSLDTRLNILAGSQTPTFVEFGVTELLVTSPEKIIEPGASGEVGEYPYDANIIITRTFHSIEPAWLIMEPSLYEELTPLSRAAVDEAVAYMTGELDNAYLKSDVAAFDALENEGAVLSGDFNSVRSRYLRASVPPDSEISQDERRFRESLSQ